jgi:glycerol-3-phosphate dehydrogenase
MTFSPAARSRALERLATESFDVVVVGGGITGAGIALDAASRGLKTALLERDDFASGTSSRSSKLVHGGLRYLDQREFRLVYEALAERQTLRRNAPHLVSVQPFLFPLFARGEGKARSQAARALGRAISTALWLYDLTGGIRIGKVHHRVKVAEALELIPALDPTRLAAAYVYYDCKADDARLTLAVVRTAVDRFGAVAANHTDVVALHKHAGRLSSVAFRDLLGGAEGVVRAEAVVNATGVWSDEIRTLDEGRDPDGLRPAKGVHITLPRSKVPASAAAVLPVPKDRRSVFLVPWGEVVYVGTTDTDYEGPLDEPVCTADEVDYLIRALNAWIREPVTPDDVVGTWAGLRPLVKGAATERTADLSRRHHVAVGASGLVTVTGGKLTTYRRMAADAVDAAFEVLGRKGARSRTRRIPLHGAEGLEDLRGDSAAGRLGVTPPVLDHLVGRYGSHARAVALMAADDPTLAEPLVPGLPYLRAEAIYAVRYEMAMTVEDVLARRTRALLLDREATALAAPAVAALMAPELGWDAAETDRQVAAFLALVDRLRRAATSPAQPDVGASLPE